MRRFLQQLMRIAGTLLLGGLIGATLVRYAPGFGSDEIALDSRMSTETRASLLRDRALPVSLPLFYVRFLRNLVRGDLGASVSLQQPVRSLIAARLPETVRSVLLGLAAAWLLAIAFAAIPLLLHSTAGDVVGRSISTLLLCIPSAVLVLFFVLCQIPCRLAVGLIVFPKLHGFLRTLLLQSAQSPYILHAQASGVGKLRILCRHIVPNATPQILALGGVSICLALGAAIPVEVLGDRAGVGQLAWKAAMARDLPMLVDLTLLVTAVTLIANAVAESLAGEMHPASL